MKKETNKPITKGNVPFDMLHFGNGHSEYRVVDATEEDILELIRKYRRNRVIVINTYLEETYV